MRVACSDPSCPAPKGLCLKYCSPDYPKCENWRGNVTDPLIEKQKFKKKGSLSLPWTGEPFQPGDIEIVGQRSVPLIIGMVGGADAGKTSYLGMLYTLLFNGKYFKNWQFVGAYTLAGWETLAQYLKIKPDGIVEFPPPTPTNPDFYSFYHLALKKGNIFRDLLFADTSGEVFSYWSEDVLDPNVGNARWVYRNSSAFIFMVDSVALIEKRGAAKSEIVQIALQIAAKLKDRPLAVVWTKADRISEVSDTIKSALDEDLAQIFRGSRFFEVSNFSKTDPDTLCHKNNLSVTEYLLDELNEPMQIEIQPQFDSSDDLFFEYRGTLRS